LDERAIIRGGGDARLAHTTPVGRLVLSGIQATLWVLAAWVLVLTRRRSGEARA